MASGKFKQLIQKYGKVALGVHLSVSGATIAGLYVAIKNNADVESVFNKLHLPSFSKEPPTTSSETPRTTDVAVVIDGGDSPAAAEKGRFRNRTAELAASSGGALALAVICNKALIPVRIPITIALTPPIARFLARRKLIKTGGGL